MDTTVVCSQCVRTRMNLKAAHTPADTNTTRVSQKKTLRPKCQNDESRYRKLDLKRRLHTFQRFTAAHTHDDLCQCHTAQEASGGRVFTPYEVKLTALH